MKSANSVSMVERREVEPRRCCIAQVQALLKRVRARHGRAKITPGVDDRIGVEVEADYPAPSLHDVHVGELEASLLADFAPVSASDLTEFRHDDPAELARARRMFALTWLVPLVLVAATLAIFGTTLGHAMTSMLQFSVAAMALPLAGSLSALLVRRWQQGRTSHVASLQKRT